MRVAILGSSHIAALKNGLAAFEEEGTSHFTSITFFGAGGPTYDRLEVRKRRLFSSQPKLRRQLVRTSGGLKDIKVDDYDHFVLHGLSLRFPYKILSAPLLSSAVTNRAVQRHIEASVMTGVLTKLRMATDKPVTVSACPLVSDAAPFLGALNQQADSSAQAYDAFLASVADLWTEHAINIIPQPENTRTGPLATDSRFSIGSTRLLSNEARHDDDDYSHMNAEYGTEWWKAFARHV